ncbi:MAG: hypothetical protein HWN67_15780 [Candidatus Helarchaeota archaeon]|nr:hypothetical protein [Candidatus Helarchaeota archaeon]
MKKKQKKLILIVLIIACIISLIIGIGITLNSVIKKDRLFILSLGIFMDDPSSSIFIFGYLIAGGQGPNFSYYVSGVVMIIIGVVGTIISIIGLKILITESTSIGSPGHRPVKIYYLDRTRKALSTRYCPACKAPLRKTPPCECEYCGSFIK